MFDETEEEYEEDHSRFDDEEATPGEGDPGQEDDDNTGNDETGEEGETGDESGEKKKDTDGDDLIKDDDPDGVVKRIGRLVKKQTLTEEALTKAKESAAYYKGLAEGGKGKEEPKKEEPKVDVAPQEEDFEDMGDYYKAVAEHSGRTAVEDAMAAKETKDKATEAKTTKDTRAETHRKRVETAMEAHPDYAEKVFVDDGTVFINDEMYENIVDSEKGAEVAYYLAEHPDEAQAIYDLKFPRAVSRAMGRIEDKVSLSTPQKSTGKSISKAPPPISPSRGGKSSPAGLRDDEPIGDWMKKRDAEVAAQEG